MSHLITIILINHVFLSPGINRFITPRNTGDFPSPRSDSCLAYDPKGSRLLVFGGWTEKWRCDLYSLNVGDIVGKKGLK